MVDLAQQYVKLRNKGARLPNFSKWVMGLFAGNQEYSNWLAAEGQNAAKRKIVMSVDVVDILRAADTPHFASCFGKPKGTSSNIDRKLADAYAGLFRAFLKHDKAVAMVTFWGPNDANSWRASGKPLLFDGNCQPKPAFHAVIAEAKKAASSK